jgi:hypothetical protein
MLVFYHYFAIVNQAFLILRTMDSRPQGNGSFMRSFHHGVGRAVYGVPVGVRHVRRDKVRGLAGSA